MRKMNKSDASKLRQGLVVLYDLARGLYKQNGAEPLPLSIAYNESQTFADPKLLKDVQLITQMMVNYSGDHLSAFVKIATEPIETTACFTCVRSMLEASAIAAWLSDSSIDVKTRVGRIFAIRYEGLEQELKYAKFVSRSGSELRSIEDRIVHLDTLATSQGYVPIKNSKNKRIGIGQLMPSATDMIATMLNEEKTYRLLSAVAHSHFWAISQLAYMQSGEASASIGGAVDNKTYEQAIDPKYLTLFGLRAAIAFAKALWYCSQYMGWDQKTIIEEFEDVFDIIQASDSVRFWR